MVIFNTAKNIENTISRLQTQVNSNIDTTKIEPNKIDALIPNDNGIKLDEDKVIAGMWEDAESTSKNTLNTNVEKSRFKNVEKVNENGIIERTRVLTLEDLTSNVLKTKPNWCPLKELPKKPDYPPINESSFVAGYNSCIDEILKGSEENEID